MGKGAEPPPEEAKPIMNQQCPYWFISIVAIGVLICPIIFTFSGCLLGSSIIVICQCQQSSSHYYLYIYGKYPFLSERERERTHQLYINGDQRVSRSY